MVSPEYLSLTIAALGFLASMYYSGKNVFKIYVGTHKVTKIYLGNIEISSIFIGTKQLT